MELWNTKGDAGALRAVRRSPALIYFWLAIKVKRSMAVRPDMAREAPILNVVKRSVIAYGVAERPKDSYHQAR